MPACTQPLPAFVPETAVDALDRPAWPLVYRNGLVLLLAASLLLLAAVADAATFTKRFTVVNNCGDNAWMWIVPPGPDVAEQQSTFWETQNQATKVCKGSDCANRNYQWKIELAAGETKSFDIPNEGSASNKVYFNLACTKTTGTFAEWGDCIIGGKFGETILGNDLSGVNTWFEATWGCSDTTGATCVPNPSDTSKKLDATDWLDLSLVDGYTVPMKMVVSDATAHNCQFQGSKAWDGVEDLGSLDLGSCPTETTKTIYSSNAAIQAQINSGGINLLTTDDSGNRINCAAPHSWFSANVLGTKLTSDPRPIAAGTSMSTLNEVNWYGCKGHWGPAPGTAGCEGPECSHDDCLKGRSGDSTYTVADTQYVHTLKSKGVEAYTWPFDDEFGLKQCQVGAQVTVTLCPAQQGQKPYQATQRWKYNGNNQGSGAPAATSSICVLAAPEDSQTYDSYYACVSAHSRYTLVQAKNGMDSYCTPDPQGAYANRAACVAATENWAMFWRNQQNNQSLIVHLRDRSLSQAFWVQPPNTQYQPYGFTDFNKDGQPDVFYRNTVTGQNALELLQVNQHLGYKELLQTSLDWYPEAFGDINADGWADVVWRNESSGKRTAHLLEDAAYKQSLDMFTVDNLAWKAVGSADFDKDGIDDLVARNASTGQNAIVLLQSDGQIKSNGIHYYSTVNIEDYGIVGVADVNADGWPDIIWFSPTTRQVYVEYMNGMNRSSIAYIRDANAGWLPHGAANINTGAAQ